MSIIKKMDDNTKTIFMLIIVSCLFLLGGLLSFYKFYSYSKVRYVKIYENSNLDYQVCLKNNNFYDTRCVDKGNQYIASLIDYIPATFDYAIIFPDEQINYTYSYDIEIEFNVLDKDNKKSLFTKKELLFSSEVLESINDTKIHHELNIDYNKYNDLLSNFVSLYDLDETTNNLIVRMHVNILSSGNTYIEDMNKNSVISLSIPLTRKTVNIDINGTTSDDSEEMLSVKSEDNYLPLLIMGITLMLMFTLIIVELIYFIKQTMTVKQIYDSRIKKITNTYASYIQKINGNYPIGASQICKVATFRDMLEIKESTDKPLLMLENDDKTGSFFIIPVGEGVIYTYALRIEDILAEQDGTKAPDYDVEDIYVSEVNRPRIYTKEKIEDDIAKTTSLSIVDDENAIRGTKDNNENLYEQLEKTTTFTVIKDSGTSKKKKKKKKKTKLEANNNNE